jgi:hypothetical protein
MLGNSVYLGTGFASGAGMMKSFLRYGRDDSFVRTTMARKPPIGKKSTVALRNDTGQAG